MLDALGIIALRDDGSVVDKLVYDYDAQRIASMLNSIEVGKPTDELISFINKLAKAGVSTIYVEHKELARNLANVIKGVEIKAELPTKVGRLFREEFWGRYLKEVYGIEPIEYIKRVHEVSVIQTRLKLKQAAERRDLFIAQAINSVDDLDKVSNLVASRLREWYGIHFPELENLTRNNNEYAVLVYKLGDRSNYTKSNIMEALPELGEERASRIAEAAAKSVGASIVEWDLQQIKALAKLYLDMQTIRENLTEYIDDAMKDVAPNIRELAGSLLGARLIALAGSLMKLALMPASTIQVLGAEKALFRALRGRGRPPKHGVIFQYPDIFRAPRWQRGKIARALAAKLAIAAKADAFTGNFIAPRLKEEFMRRVQEVKTIYAKPPPRKPAAKPHGKPERKPSRR
ncbi:NOP5/NOP56 family protein [Caldivirga maquilingensis]|uniref:Pre-mRNA processing ribonucleoprotein, binding region n=1 Tax=Caldivirga maquilingensis (strain ATCC 700844 / DSM 13496 / JCM 10307 / IC-167) TaxID=397948 RepID=A8M8P2_CALMQ|nr:Pre-mRNA processing ribonucleoprotein, binding region [Caldivirga maquilingensis IC-167]